MKSLVLMEQGLEIGVEGELFVVRKGGKEIEKVRVAEVDEVLLFGNISMTPACIALVLSRGIDTVFMTYRGRYRGRLAGPVSKNPELRLMQYKRQGEEDFQRKMAKALVRGKITNQRRILLRAQRELRNETLAEAAAKLRRLLGSLEEKEDRESIRGVEGSAAAACFGVFGKLIKNDSFTFRRRTRRPPRDPVNAMLSFGYTLLNHVMENFIHRAGLDPSLGSFHAPEYGRPSLSLDLIEEFRPIVVDSLVLRILNRKQVTLDDFEEPDEPHDYLMTEEIVGERSEEEKKLAGSEGKARAIWLGETGRKIFFREWGKRLRETLYYEPRMEVRTLKDIMGLQVYHYIRVLKGEEENYIPFTPR